MANTNKFNANISDDDITSLAIIDNIHDFYKKTRVEDNIIGFVRNKLEVLDPNIARKGFFTSLSLPEDQTVDYFETKYASELKTRSTKIITYDQIINASSESKILESLKYCDVLKIEFADGQSIATTNSTNLKKIGSFIIKFMLNRRDDDKISDKDLTHFTFDGSSGALSAILFELKYCINLITPQNIADSASSTINHFGPRSYFYFPKKTTSSTNIYEYESNILSKEPIRLTNKEFNPKKRHFDFNVGNDFVSYNDTYRQGPGVSYLASLIAQCLGKTGVKNYYTSTPSTSAILDVKSLLIGKSCDRNTILIFDIKRSGDWEQVLSAKQSSSTGGMTTVIGSIDRLCILFSRINAQPCILIDPTFEGVTCCRFNVETNKVLATSRYFKDLIEETIPLIEIISKDKLKLITFAEGRIEHLKKAKFIQFNKDIPEIEPIKNAIIDKIISELKSIIDTNLEITGVDYTFIKSNLITAQNWLSLLENKPISEMDTISKMNEYIDGPFTLNVTNNSILYNYDPTDPTVIMSIKNECEEIKNIFKSHLNYEKKFKELDIRYESSQNVNGEQVVTYYEWGIHNNTFFIKPTAKKPGPIMYDHKALTEFCKGVLTIKTYDSSNRRTNILDYSVELENFLKATSKLSSILIDVPIKIILDGLSYFYEGENYLISKESKKKYNDSYMVRAKTLLGNLLSKHIGGNALIQNNTNKPIIMGGGELINEIYIHQINWHIINEMAYLEQILINNEQGYQINITEFLEEILINTESRIINFMNDSKLLEVTIPDGLDSIKVLNELFYTIQRNYSEFITIGENYFSKDFLVFTNYGQNNYDIQLKEIELLDVKNRFFFLTLNNIFISKSNTDNIKSGYYESNVKNIIDGISGIDVNTFVFDILITFSNLKQFTKAYNEVINVKPVPMEKKIVTKVNQINVPVTEVTRVRSPETSLSLPPLKKQKYYNEHWNVPRINTEIQINGGKRNTNKYKKTRKNTNKNNRKTRDKKLSNKKRRTRKIKIHNKSTHIYR